MLLMLFAPVRTRLGLLSLTSMRRKWMKIEGHEMVAGWEGLLGKKEGPQDWAA